MKMDFFHSVFSLKLTNKHFLKKKKNQKPENSSIQRYTKLVNRFTQYRERWS